MRYLYLAPQSHMARRVSRPAARAATSGAPSRSKCGGSGDPPRKVVGSAALLAAAALCVAVGRCAPAGEPGARPAEAAGPLIAGVPHVKQKPDFCGEACAEMVLRHLGKAATQDDVFNAGGVDPLLGRGCWTKELAVALGRIGFKVGEVWHKLPVEGSTGRAATAAQRQSPPMGGQAVAVPPFGADPASQTGYAGASLAAQWSAVQADLARGIPSIVCTHYDDKPGATEHFRLVLGYDAKTDEVVYHDPGRDDGAYLRMKKAEFLALWVLKSPDGAMVIRLRMEPGDIRIPQRAAGFTAADFAQHIMVLKKKVPAFAGSAGVAKVAEAEAPATAGKPAGFTVALAGPFVVVGDEAPETVRRRATGVVKWAVDHLKADFFTKDTDDIIDVWLFKDKESYEKHARSIFGDTPDTPYGYYSSTHKALIMNIQTGGGTLVHEIVHPLMRANFPDCPTWFNEGLASLYEQCEEKGGHICGRTNWRLDGLQKAIRAGGLASFKDLTATTDGQFYREGRGDNYAQARYLCLYLQERGLLVKLFHEFVARHKDDPTGYKTLQSVLGETDMAAFQKRWEAWVLKLKFP